MPAEGPLSPPRPCLPRSRSPAAAPRPGAAAPPPRSPRRQRVRAADGRRAPGRRVGRAGAGRGPPPRLRRGERETRGVLGPSRPVSLPKGVSAPARWPEPFPSAGTPAGRQGRAEQSGPKTDTHRPRRRPQPALRQAARSRYRRRHFAGTPDSQRGRMRERAANGAATRKARRERPIVLEERGVLRAGCVGVCM